MKNIILAFSILFLYTACETGTKYDKNETKEETNKKEVIKQLDNSILDLIEDKKSATELVKKSYIEEGKKPYSHKYDPENPLNGEALLNESYIESNDEVDKVGGLEKRIEAQEFTGNQVTNGLNVKSIRVGYHDTYTRLVFDVEQNGEKAKKVGKYSVNYEEEENIIFVTLNGYSGFSAKIPNFSSKGMVEKIYFDQSPFNFSIKLRETATVKYYDYKNPARLIIDVHSL